MTLKKATRSAQRVLEAEFTLNYDDTMVPVAGGSATDFGKAAAAGVFDVINLPVGSVVVGGSLTVSTAFDTAGFDVKVGDADSDTRYLGSTDVKSAGVTPLVPTGYVNTGGLNIRLTFGSDDVCTQGVATLRVQFIITGRADEVYPN